MLWLRAIWRHDPEPCTITSRYSYCQIPILPYTCTARQYYYLIPDNHIFKYSYGRLIILSFTYIPSYTYWQILKLSDTHTTRCSFSLILTLPDTHILRYSICPMPFSGQTNELEHQPLAASSPRGFEPKASRSLLQHPTA